MDANSEMQAAEAEIRELLNADHIGSAMTRLFTAYTAKSSSEKDAFVAVLIGRTVTAISRQRTAKPIQISDNS